MLLPDYNTRLAVGGAISGLLCYFDSRRGAVEQTGTALDTTGRTGGMQLYGGGYIEPGVGFVGNGSDAYGTLSLPALNVSMMACWLNTATAMGPMLASGSSIFPMVWVGGSTGDVDGETLSVITGRPEGGKFAEITYAKDVIPTSTWIHIAWRWDSSTYLPYMNGVALTAYTNGPYVADRITADQLTRVCARPQYGQFSNHSIDHLMFLTGDDNATESTIAALYESQRHLFGV